MTAQQFRTAVVKLVVKAGVKPDLAPVRKSRGLMARRLLTPIMLTLIMMQSVTSTADANVVRHPGNKPGIISGSILSNGCLLAHTLAKFPPYWEDLPQELIPRLKLQTVSAIAQPEGGAVSPILHLRRVPISGVKPPLPCSAALRSQRPFNSPVGWPAGGTGHCPKRE